MDRVVVGIDGRAPAGPALARAAHEARARGAVLEVVTVWTYPPLSTEERLMSTPGLMEDEARTLAALQVESVLGPRPLRDLRVEVRVERGPPARCLLDAASGADLLVVGRRDRARMRHLLLGSVADQCLRHAPCPTMVVPHPEDHNDVDGPIVVGVDGSPSSRRALRWALEEGRRTDRSLRAIHCWQLRMTGSSEAPLPRPDRSALASSARQHLNSLVADVEIPGAVDIERAVLEGAAATILVDEAEQAEMLVVGSRGLGGFRRLLLGSVAHHVAHLAACPVVVLPHQAA